MTIRTFVFGLGAAVGMLASMPALADADNGKQPGFGPNPQLPEPTTSLVPTINVARAIGWTIGEKPSTPSDLAVTAYASGLDHPRWIYTLPNGDLVVNVIATSAPSLKRMARSGRKMAKVSKPGLAGLLKSSPEPASQVPIASFYCVV